MNSVEDTGGSDEPQPVNLNDLQNYLVTFNKEIEPSDQPDAAASDSTTTAATNDEPGTEAVYVDVADTTTQEPTNSDLQLVFQKKELDTEQDVSTNEDSSVISTESIQIQSIIPTSETETQNQSSTEISNDQNLSESRVETIDTDTSLSDVHAQIAHLAATGQVQATELTPEETEQLTGQVQAQLVSGPEGQMHTVTVEGLNSDSQHARIVQVQVPVSGDGDQGQQKIVHVVSLGGEHMQLVDPTTGAMSEGGHLIHLTPTSTTTATSELTTETGVIDGTDPVAVLASVAANTSNVSQIQSVQVGQTELNAAQLVALQNSADTSQPQLVAVQTGEPGNETIQVIGSTDPGQGSQPIILNGPNSQYQTVTIMPSDVSANGEMNYVLIMPQPEGDKEGEEVEKQIALGMGLYDFKNSDREIVEEVVEEDGTTKRILRITPKKFVMGIQGSPNSEMMCNYCNYTSPKRYLLTRHMKSHSEDRPHKCNICERCFKTMASLQNHVNTHTGTRPHKCKQCEAAFTTSGELVRHIRYKHTFEKPHKCTECDYASVELSKLKRHMRSHTGERPYQCPHCHYASPDTYKLKRHMRIHTGEKPYECDVCHAKFTQSNSLKAHKLIHSGNKPVFQCELCPTTCGRKTDLKIHMQKLHTSEKPLVCRKCNKTLPDRYTYKMHIKSHDGEKCFKCDHCDYAALSQRHLESHSLTHTGEKPFECDECEQTFRQKQLLKRHKNLYHTPDYSPPEPKDKMYDCTECDKSFAHKGNLLRHMQLHDPDNPLYRDIDDSPPRRRSIEGSSVPLTAEQLLQGSILNEMKEGKLGNTPKVVIVHPDGRVEEVTSKLQSMVQEKTMEDMLLAAVEQADNSGIEHVTSQQVTNVASQTQPSGTTVQNVFTTVPVVSVNSEQKPMIDNTAKVSSFESVIIPIVTQPSLQGVNIVSTTAQNPGIATVLSTDNLHPVTVYQQGTSTVSEQPVSITFQQGTSTVSEQPVSITLQQGTSTVSEQPVPITLQQRTSTVSIVRAAQVDPKSSQDGSTIVILPQEETKDVETQAAIESGDEAEEVYHIVHVADSNEEASHGNLHIDLSLNNQQTEAQSGRKRKDPESEVVTVNKKQCT